MLLGTALLAAACGSSKSSGSSGAATSSSATTAATTTSAASSDTTAAGTTSTSAGASGTTATAGKSDVTLTLLTYDSFAYTDDVLKSFTTKTGIKVNVAKGNDAGEVLNKAILTKGSPEGDVLWGVDNTLLSRAVDSKTFSPYESPELANLDPAAVALVPGHELTPVDQGDVCVNYDKGWYTKKGVEPPKTLDDLTKPAYKGQLVVENPATSSPGLAFLLATIARYGNDGWQGYWKQLKANDVEVVDGWTQAYSERFSGSTGKGPKPLVVSYGSSPPAEIVFATDPKPTEPPTGVMTDGCFRQIEFAGVLQGTKHEAEARQLVDFLVSQPFQEDMPLNMFVYPVRKGAALPDVFTKYAAVPSQPLTVAPADITANREQWIDQWTKLVLR